MATFDSKQFGWAEISVLIGGRIIEGISEVEYTEKQEKELLYGRGNKPYNVLRGNKSFEGKIKIWQSELEAMTRSTPDSDILNINFDIVVTYVPREGVQMVTDVLKGVEFTEVKKGMAQGDKNMEVELPIIFLSVKRIV